jgi:hypothetical protein
MARPARKQTSAPRAAATPKTDVFKTKDIKEDVLIDRVIKQAGVNNDAETTGFIKSVLPRFAEANPRQAFTSMSKMVKEFGRATGPSTSGQRETAQANGGGEPQRRKPGRPKGSKNKPTSDGPSNDKGQASAGSKRGPGRPRKSDRPQA